MPALLSAVGRSLPLIAAAVAVVLWAHTAAPPASACSCVGPQPMAAYAIEPRSAVLTGVPGPLSARGVPVQVTRWFKGPGATRVVWLSADSFGEQSAACQRTPPTIGRELGLVLYMPEDGSDPSGSICTPIAESQSDEGQRMLAEAVATFGAPAVPVDAAAPVEGDGPFDDLVALAPAMGALVAGAALLALVIAVLVRVDRRRASHRPPSDPSDAPGS